MINKLLCTTAVVLALAGCSRSDPNLNQTGANPDLPGLNQTLVPPMKIATPIGWDGETPTVPDGFVVTPMATDLQIPRQILVLPNGDILIAEGSGGHAPKLRPKDIIAGVIKAKGKTSVKGGNRITLLRDANGDGQPEVRTTFIDNLDAPYGMAFVDGALYVAEQGALVRFDYQPGQTRITASRQEVTKLPSAINHHWTKSLTASADGQTLYVGIGSNRNPTALAIEPTTSALWAVVNERDELGPQLVPDYLTSVREGAFYGWPYSYWGQNIDPRVRPQNPDLVQSAIAPDYALGSHVAALGLSFATAGGFGGGFSQGAFIGEHGSWNRQDLSGYKVAWVPFSGGRPAGPPVDFVTGFIKDGEARGRPVGVTFDAQRRILLVADDLSNTVWRIAPRR